MANRISFEACGEQGNPVSDELTIPAVPASATVTPECDCYVHRFNSIAPGRRAGCYAYICFADESGQGLSPPRGRTWAMR